LVNILCIYNNQYFSQLSLLSQKIKINKTLMKTLPIMLA